MNKKEGEEFKQIFKACCEVTGKNFSDNVLVMYLRALEKTDFQAIKAVMMEFFKRGKFPCVDDILARIGEKEISPEEKARLLSQQVIAALAKFGWCNEKGAKEHFGLDWDIITGFQSWGMLCNLTNEDLSTFSAQFRNYAEIRLRQKRSQEMAGEIDAGRVVDIKALASSVDVCNRL